MDIARRILSEVLDISQLSSAEIQEETQKIAALLPQGGGSSGNGAVAAMAAIQVEIEDPERDTPGQVRGRRDYMYANLESFLPGLRRLCGKHGCALVQSSECVSGVWGVLSRLVHPDGSELSSFVPFPDEAMTDGQAVGRIQTYCRRYGLWALFGLTHVEADTDAAPPRPVPPSPPRPVSSSPPRTVSDRLDHLEKAMSWYQLSDDEDYRTLVDGFLKHIGRPPIQDLSEDRFSAMLNFLQTPAGKQAVMDYVNLAVE